MEVKILEFGKTKNGETVFSYILKNSFLEIEILNYGGVIRSLKMPNKNGEWEEIVLNYETIEEYENDKNHFACITGRVAGRIKNAILKIDEEVYELEKNNGKNNLHGGSNAIDKKIWNAKVKCLDDKSVLLTLKYFSPHLEEGFPGNVNFKVNYLLKENNLEIEYFGESDRNTYINLTNHAYFNLTGDFSNIKNETLKLDIQGYGKVNEETLPVKFEENDNFIEPNIETKLEDIFNSKHEQVKIVGQGIDHPFILNKSEEYVGTLKDKESGRVMKFKTNQPVVVIYTGNFLEEKHTGICFETQDYPDIFNFMPEKVKIYNKEEKYYQKTMFTFEVEK